jgi:uncharacterized protein YlxW (UPF0749 family)
VDTPILVALLALVASVVTGFFTWRTSGRANDRNADLGWAREIRQDAIDARKEVEALQAKVATLSRQVEAMQRETEYWIGQYQLAHRTAWRSGMTLERLREFLGPDAPRTPATGT